MGAFTINERDMIDGNIFLYEDRLSNPTTRFQDESPTFVTYYHLDYEVSGRDPGFGDTKLVLGRDSANRYHKITDFQMIMSNEIQPNLQEMDQGLDTEFEGEATILPGTIRPLPDDFFIIPYLHGPFVFRVTGVDYDQAKPKNYYKINFMLHSILDEDIEWLEKQTIKKFTCISENIGTEKICILDDEINEKLKKINVIYNDIREMYKIIFFNERYGCFLGVQDNGRFLYDPFQADFVNRHDLFNQKNDLETIYVTNHYDDKFFKLKYEQSIYRAFERRNLDFINEFGYFPISALTVVSSGFCAWNDTTVDILEIIKGQTKYPNRILSEEFIGALKYNLDVDSNYGNMIKKFIRNEERMTLDDIPEDLNTELLALNPDMELFFFTPIILYIIRVIINETMLET